MSIIHSSSLGAGRVLRSAGSKVRSGSGSGADRTVSGADRTLGRRQPSGTESGRGNVVELFPEASRRPGYRGRVRFMGSEAGMATAEYAIATLAAVGFAGLLVFILRSDEVRGFLLTLIRTALALP
jgi:hypothetical protein